MDLRHEQHFCREMLCALAQSYHYFLNPGFMRRVCFPGSPASWPHADIANSVRYAEQWFFWTGLTVWRISER